MILQTRRVGFALTSGERRSRSFIPFPTAVLPSPVAAVAHRAFGLEDGSCVVLGLRFRRNAKGRARKRRAKLRRCEIVCGSFRLRWATPMDNSDSTAPMDFFVAGAFTASASPYRAGAKSCRLCRLEIFGANSANCFPFRNGRVAFQDEQETKAGVSKLGEHFQGFETSMEMLDARKGNRWRSSSGAEAET